MLRRIQSYPTALVVAPLVALLAGCTAESPLSPDFAKGGTPGPPEKSTDTTLPASIDPCEEEIVALHDAIDAAVYKKDRDEEALLGKNVDAAEKLNADKFEDALGKLGDIRSKLEGWEEAGEVGPVPPHKIDAEGFDGIMDALGPAQGCVETAADG